jgi:hypothetical protein
MTDREKIVAAGEGDRDERRLAELLRRVGPRPAPSEDARRRVHAATRAAWQAKLGERRRRRTHRVVWTIAAAAALVAAVLWLRPSGPQHAVVFATVEIARGGASVAIAPSGEGRPLAVGDELRPGATVTTAADGALALRTAAGHSLRVAAGSTLRVLSASGLALPAGTAYVDAAPRDAAVERLSVATPFGMVSHVGTRYEIRVTERALRVRVRDGLVHVVAKDETHDATTGVSLVVDAAGQVERSATEIVGPSWDWVAATAPAPAIDGRRLEEFLRWVSRETGLTVTWTDPELHERSRGIVLAGSIEGLTPGEALYAVLPTCGLAHRIEASELIVEEAPGEP